MFIYIVKQLAVMSAVLLIYLPVRRPWRDQSARAWVEGVFVAFMAGLLALALQGRYLAPAAMAKYAAGRLESGEGINLVPFRSISGFFPAYLSRQYFGQYWNVHALGVWTSSSVEEKADHPFRGAAQCRAAGFHRDNPAFHWTQRGRG